MTTENSAPMLQQLAAREGIDVTDLYIERPMVFMRKSGVMVGTVCQAHRPEISTANSYASIRPLAGNGDSARKAT